MSRTDTQNQRRTTNPRAALALVAVIVAASVAPAAVAQESWIYLANDASYGVIHPASGAVVYSGELAGTGGLPPKVVPTPGGRYVFLLLTGQDRAIVVDAETHQIARTVELPTGTRGITFSSMGDSIYALTGGNARLALPHRRGEVTGVATEAPSVGPEAIAFNRRATRIYGNRGGDLVYALAGGGEPVNEVDLRGGPYHWTISPNFRFLLGVSGDRIALVDETRGRVTGYINGLFEPRPGSGGNEVSSLAGIAFFDEGSRLAYVLAASGTEIVVADTRRFAVEERIEPTIALSAVWQDGEGTIHGFARDQRRLLIDIGGEDRVVTLPAELAGGEAALVTLKPGQGFACF